MPAEISAGRALFKWRSLTPVPVLILVGWLLWRDRHDPSALPATAFLSAGLVLALLGQALRARVLGQVPEGTSGQGNALEAVVLNTAGPYARVRNPLYLGNLLIVSGLLLAAWDAGAAAVILAFFFGQYFFIIRAEEAFLRERFGTVFDTYCRQVPRWVPRLTPATLEPLSTRFDWRRALRKEHNPFTAWASGMLLLAGWHLAVRDTDCSSALLPALVAAEVALLAAFAAVKGWKHGWFKRG